MIDYMIKVIVLAKDVEPSVIKYFLIPKRKKLFLSNKV